MALASDKPNPAGKIQAGPEQVLYAKILEKGMYFGLLALIITFAVYVFRILKPYIPLRDLPKYWSMGVNDYLHATGIHAGWTWMGMLRYGDFLNFIPIAVLASVTLVCFASIVPLLWRQNDKVYAILALGEVLILTVAASSILGTGGH